MSFARSGQGRVDDAVAAAPTAATTPPAATTPAAVGGLAVAAPIVPILLSGRFVLLYLAR